MRPISLWGPSNQGPNRCYTEKPLTQLPNGSPDPPTSCQVSPKGVYEDFLTGCLPLSKPSFCIAFNLLFVVGSQVTSSCSFSCFFTIKGYTNNMLCNGQEIKLSDDLRLGKKQQRN